MPSVKVKPHEPFDIALRRFKRACEKAGILTEVRAREAYEKPTTVRKREKAAAVKRSHKKLQRDKRRPRDARMRMKTSAKTSAKTFSRS